MTLVIVAGGVSTQWAQKTVLDRRRSKGEKEFAFASEPAPAPATAFER